MRTLRSDYQCPKYHLHNHWVCNDLNIEKGYNCLYNLITFT